MWVNDTKCGLEEEGKWRLRIPRFSLSTTQGAQFAFSMQHYDTLLPTVNRNPWKILI